MENIFSPRQSVECTYVTVIRFLKACFFLYIYYFLFLQNLLSIHTCKKQNKNKRKRTKKQKVYTVKSTKGNQTQQYADSTSRECIQIWENLSGLTLSQKFLASRGRSSIILQVQCKTVGTESEIHCRRIHLLALNSSTLSRFSEGGLRFKAPGCTPRIKG